MRNGRVEDGGTVAAEQEAVGHIQQLDQQVVRRCGIEADPLRPMQRPRMRAGHGCPHLGTLDLRLAPGDRGDLGKPLRQPVQCRHPSPVRAGCLREQHLAVEGQRHEPGGVGQPWHAFAGAADPGPPGVVPADAVSADGHQELAVGIRETAPPRGVECRQVRAVRRRDPPSDAPAGFRREQAARTDVLDDRQPNALEQLVKILSVRHTVMIRAGSRCDKALPPARPASVRGAVVRGRWNGRRGGSPTGCRSSRPRPGIRRSSSVPVR
ncbi:hypothetical protein SXANM310S_03575 [Streptomyces xanthochromogenes]